MMKKRQLLGFLPYDQVGMAQHLEKMAQKGWRLRAISSLWTYEKAEPAQLTYCVTYCPKASYYDPKPSSQQETFYDYCQEAGWDLVCESGVFQVFVANRPNPVPMDTDPQQKLDTVCAAMKKVYGPAQWLLLLVSLLQIWMQIHDLTQDPLDFFSQYFGCSQLLVWTLLPASLLISYGGYRQWRKVCQQSLDCGEAYLEGHDRFRWLTRLFLTISFSALLLSMAGLFSVSLPMALFGTVPILFVFAFSSFLTKWLKRCGCTPKVHMAVLIASSIFLTVGCFSTLTFLLVSDVISLDAPASRSVTLANSNVTIQLYDDVLPLEVEDLYPVDFPNYSYEYQSSSTVFLSTVQGEQSAWNAWESEAPYVPELSYTVLNPHFDWMYDLAFESLMTQFHYDWLEEWEYHSFFSIDPNPWGVSQAYQRQDEEGNWRPTYILEKNGTLVSLTLSNFPDDVPTQAQMDTIVKGLF